MLWLGGYWGTVQTKLADVFIYIFNQFLSQCVIPPCLNSSTIILIPKKSTPSSLDNSWPLALTTIITKCFEKLVWSHITSCLLPTFDPHQFVYRANRSTEDMWKSMQLCQGGIIDFSSAFSTIIPHRLVTKLMDFFTSAAGAKPKEWE